MKLLRTAAVGVLTFALGCSSDEPTRAAPAARFTPDPPTGTSDAVVFLRSQPASAEKIRVEVVARGVDRGIHGAAFRLHWDATKLAFERAQSSTSWSRQALALAKEGAPGELVVLWSEKGSSSGVAATDETILGTLEFTKKSAEGAVLEFRIERSTLRDANGSTLAVEWRGGTIAGPLATPK